jgi:hypothetical protein
LESEDLRGAINDSYFKRVKAKGEFEWQSPQEEDELFLVMKRLLTIKTRAETSISTKDSW